MGFCYILKQHNYNINCNNYNNIKQYSITGMGYSENSTTPKSRKLTGHDEIYLVDILLNHSDK